MTKATKDTIKAVIVLFVIALVCVALLAVANVFLKTVPTLDSATASKINTIAPSGVDDATAFSEGYFKLYSEEELASAGFDLKAFNKEKGNATNKVTAVYRVVKGQNAGTFIVESTGKGYYDITMLTAFDEEGKISGVIAKTQTEDKFSGQIFNEDKFELFKQSVIGKSELPSDSELNAVTGATTMSSMRGLRQAVTIATVVIPRLNSVADALEVENE